MIVLGEKCLCLWRFPFPTLVGKGVLWEPFSKLPNMEAMKTFWWKFVSHIDWTKLRFGMEFTSSRAVSENLELIPSGNNLFRES